MNTLSDELDKYERIKQLESLGYNVPLLMRIPCGTKFDKKLEARLLHFAGGRRRMTVRTYAPEDEKRRGGGPFKPEITTRRAISMVRAFLPHFHVLFQEAIDKEKTRLVGRALFDPSARNMYEVLKGKVRVRQIDNPPPGLNALVGFFGDPIEISDEEVRIAMQRFSRLPLALRQPGPIIVEWNLQEPSDPVGVKSDPLLLWEWRPGA